MIAIGCLFPIVLPPLAALLGYWLFGPSGGIWGAVGGFVLGVATAGVTAWAFERLKND
jgi:hypothetical protein